MTFLRFVSPFSFKPVEDLPGSLPDGPLSGIQLPGHVFGLVVSGARGS
jgi:hypothetical protein